MEYKGNTNIVSQNLKNDNTLFKNDDLELYYESQPKAWAEYRYKWSETKLVWGVWGGGGSDLGPFWEGEAGACLGRAQKNEAPLPSFLKVEREAPFWTLLVVFWRFSDVFHRVSKAKTL